MREYFGVKKSDQTINEERFPDAVMFFLIIEASEDNFFKRIKDELVNIWIKQSYFIILRSVEKINGTTQPLKWKW